MELRIKGTYMLYRNLIWNFLDNNMIKKFIQNAWVLNSIYTKKKTIKIQYHMFLNYVKIVQANLSHYSWGPHYTYFHNEKKNW